MLYCSYTDENKEHNSESEPKNKTTESSAHNGIASTQQESRPTDMNAPHFSTFDESECLLGFTCPVCNMKRNTREEVS